MFFTAEDTFFLQEQLVMSCSKYIKISENTNSLGIVFTGMNMFFFSGTRIYFRERIKIVL